MPTADPDAPNPRPGDTANALALIREALALLDRAGCVSAADFLQHAIDMIEEERWARTGVQALHRIVQ